MPSAASLANRGVLSRVGEGFGYTLTSPYLRWAAQCSAVQCSVNCASQGCACSLSHSETRSSWVHASHSQMSEAQSIVRQSVQCSGPLVQWMTMHSTSCIQHCHRSACMARAVARPCCSITSHDGCELGPCSRNSKARKACMHDHRVPLITLWLWLRKAKSKSRTANKVHCTGATE